MNRIVKMEKEILKQNLDIIRYDPFNSLPSYVFILNKILPAHSELVDLFAEIEITDKRIIADHMAKMLRKMKGTTI